MERRRGSSDLPASLGGSLAHLHFRGVPCNWVASIMIGFEGSGAEGDETVIPAACVLIDPTLGTSKVGVALRVFARFAESAKAEFGPVGTALAGPDPPDLVVTRNGGEVGLEVTSYSRAEVRQVTALVSWIAEDLGRAEADITHLLGWEVAVTPKAATSELDVNRATASAIARDIVAIHPAAHSRRIDVPAFPLPPRLPTPRPFETAGGFEIYTQPSVPARVALSVEATEQLSARELEAELRSQIADKDIPENEELLVSFGAPDHRGWAWPYQTLLFDFLLRHPISRVETHHLRRIFLLDYVGGRVMEVPVLSPTGGPGA